jgi:hypothetical protein
MLPALRRRGWSWGLAWWITFLLPVAFLKNHTYRYYAYASIVGLSWMTAAALAALYALASQRPQSTQSGRRPVSWRTTGVVTAVLAVLSVALVWRSYAVVQTMETRPSIVDPVLRGDPIIDRGRIAERVLHDVGEVDWRGVRRLEFILRERAAMFGRIAQGSGETMPPEVEQYPEANVSAALAHGVGVRVFYPALDSVVFVLRPQQVRTTTRWALYAATGELEVYSAPAFDSLLRSPWAYRYY